jgi:hypothetical protein
LIDAGFLFSVDENGNNAFVQRQGHHIACSRDNKGTRYTTDDNSKSGRERRG